MPQRDLTNGARRQLSAHRGVKRACMPVPQASAVSLVILVRNEGRNIAWVLDRIADDVSELMLDRTRLDTDATLATARNHRPDVIVVPQKTPVRVYVNLWAARPKDMQSSVRWTVGLAEIVDQSQGVTDRRREIATP
jgi:hypothetical protein